MELRNKIEVTDTLNQLLRHGIVDKVKYAELASTYDVLIAKSGKFNNDIDNLKLQLRNKLSKF